MYIGICKVILYLKNNIEQSILNYISLNKDGYLRNINLPTFKNNIAYLISIHSRVENTIQAVYDKILLQDNITLNCIGNDKLSRTKFNTSNQRLSQSYIL